MNIEPIQIALFFVALAGLVMVIAGVRLLLVGLIKVAAITSGAGLGIFAGVTLSIIGDVRIMMLVASNMTLLSVYESGNWRYLASISVIEAFALSGLYIVTFLYGAFRRDGGEINKQIRDLVKLGAGFWGVAGLIVSFSLACYMMNRVWAYPAFSNMASTPLSYNDAVRYALQSVIDLSQINFKEIFGISLSDMRVAEGKYVVGSFVVLYKLLLLLSFVHVVAHLAGTVKKWGRP